MTERIAEDTSTYCTIDAGRMQTLKVLATETVVPTNCSMVASLDNNTVAPSVTAALILLPLLHVDDEAITITLSALLKLVPVICETESFD